MGTAGATASRGKPLSEAEQHVAELLCMGMTNEQIGHRLFVSDKTVKYHVTSILIKSGTSSRLLFVVNEYRKQLGLTPVGLESRQRKSLAQVPQTQTLPTGRKGA